jgi:copper oxidase (laccase) domain-containing protein
VTSVPGARLAVRTADCVPIVLSRGLDAIADVHAGWRGLAAGIVPAAIEAMGGATSARLGPHIRAGCYEFGAAELDDVAAQLGDGVRGSTMWGTPALDLTAAAHAALGDIPVTDSGVCTACTGLFPSWRARREAARFATIAWLEP